MSEPTWEEIFGEAKAPPELPSEDEPDKPKQPDMNELLRAAIGRKDTDA